MQAYHGREDLKAAVLTIIGEHEAADQIAQGAYYDTSTGTARMCAVGCALESLRRIEGLSEIEHSAHALYERYLGVPIMLARLEDSVFEGLPAEEARTWPRRFAEAIRPGADLAMVWPTFLRALLADPAGGVQIGAAKRPAVQPSIAAILALFDEWIASGVKPDAERWHTARRTAADAAAADADAYAAARWRERRRQADVLIALLRAA